MDLTTKEHSTIVARNMATAAKIDGIPREMSAFKEKKPAQQYVKHVQKNRNTVHDCCDII